MTSRCLLLAALLLAALYVEGATAQVSYQEQWRTASFGSGIGATGIWPVDVDNDGIQELVLSGQVDSPARSSFWSIAAFNPQTGGYEIRWQSPRYFEGTSAGCTLSALRVVQAGATLRAWVGCSNGKLDIVDLLTRETVVRFGQQAPGRISDFAVADLDNNGVVDVAVLTPTRILLYDPETLELRRTVEKGGQKFAVGNVDADARLETVFDNGVVLDLDRNNENVQWTSPTPFGQRMTLADVDGDGLAEVVAAIPGAPFETIRAWDVEAKLQRWSYSAASNISALRVLDVSGNAAPEIVYADTQSGGVHVLDAMTRAELLQVPNPDYDVTDFAVLDTDGDGDREMVWGAGFRVTSADSLNIFDLTTRDFAWKSHDHFGPYEGVAIGDLEGDGTLEIVAATHKPPSDNGFDNAMIVVLDAVTHAVKWSTPVPEGGIPPFNGLHRVQLANVDSDPQLEILVASDSYNQGALYVLDGLTHAQGAPVVPDPGFTLAWSQLTRADLDGDGQQELIAGTWTANNIGPGSFVYVLDPATYDVLWKSPALQNDYIEVSQQLYAHSTDLAVADVGPPGLDILSVSARVHAIRWSDHRVVESVGNEYLSVVAADVSPATGAEILAGRKDGRVDVLDGDTLAVIATHAVCSWGGINALQTLGGSKVIAACADRLLVYDLATESVVDEARSTANNLGLNASFARALVNGRDTIVVGGDEIVSFVDVHDNDPPTLSGVDAIIHWRATSVDLQLNATDANQDPLRFELTSLPESGTPLWLDARTGRLRYTSSATAPRVNYDTMNVRVFDGSHYSDEQRITIFLTNTSPSVGSGLFNVNGSAAISGQMPVTDADGDPLHYVITQQDMVGTLTIDDATGAFRYTPAANTFSSTAPVSFTVTDGVATAAGTLEFRYPAASSPPASGGGGGGGGGSSGLVLLSLLAGLSKWRQRLTRRKS